MVRRRPGLCQRHPVGHRRDQSGLLGPARPRRQGYRDPGSPHSQLVRVGLRHGGQVRVSRKISHPRWIFAQFALGTDNKESDIRSETEFVWA
jgi:hypothetical protein